MRTPWLVGAAMGAALVIGLDRRRRRLRGSLADRVRARLDRAVRRPAYVDARVDGNRVTLTGTLAAAELERALRAVRGVAGVGGVDSHVVATAGMEAAPWHRFRRDPPARSSVARIGAIAGIAGLGALLAGVYRVAMMDPDSASPPGDSAGPVQATPIGDELRPIT